MPSSNEQVIKRYEELERGTRSWREVGGAGERLEELERGTRSWREVRGAGL